ncbi:class I SAM-dependent methyltransferase [Stagnimonas aquatica]|uniref:Class I SAM-dependent methyltransferase n=1 Tax=Stagnimonas aquatica TaxID=2689987 RepID=A0A3N0VKH7_9GAMM|nr:class I SAM-dependent methyltransferase [Stagnimonas aquatica]ROH93211.1 class I SAM-dependent methyltransferase [Stagnimonas aquatica]
MSSRAAPPETLKDLLRRADQAARAGLTAAQFDALLASLDSAARPHAGCDGLLDFLRAHRPAARHADIDRVWVLALDEVWARPAELAAPLAEYLALSPPVAAALSAPDPVSTAVLAALEADLLLHRLLALSPLPQPRWEALLAALAARLLIEAGAACQRYPRLLVALALWAQQTGRLALPTTDATVRAAAHASLIAAAAQGRPPPEALLAWAFLAAAPEPGDWAPVLARLPAGELVRRLLAEPLAEAELARSWPAATTVDAGLAAQYEDDPYPRWQAEPRRPWPPPAGVTRLLPARPRVLIAGCGSGQQLLRAADRYPGARLQALDFSRSSLAYAQRACAAAGLRGVEWRCADLLSLTGSGARYDLVECIGVLHHLPDPAAGLAALASVLAPGGLLCAAVYSARARAEVRRLRELWPAPAFEGDEAVVRQGRAAYLRGDYGSPDPAIVGSIDFYSRAGCRDLLFNRRERHYRLPEFLAEAEAAGFDWLQLEAPAPVAEQAARRLGRPAERLDAAQWDAYEADAPRSFGGMYQVWLRRRG